MQVSLQPLLNRPSLQCVNAFVAVSEKAIFGALLLTTLLPQSRPRQVQIAEDMHGIYCISAMLFESLSTLPIALACWH